jgi:hypothetical protein
VLTEPDPGRAYLDLLKRSLLGLTTGPVTLHRPVDPPGKLRSWILRTIVRPGDAVLAQPVVIDLDQNAEGTLSVWDLPSWPMTMIGAVRLDNVEACISDALESGVPGDLIETGVWRGGTTIFMRGVLRAYGIEDRTVYVADSFAGLPTPDAERYPADAALDLHLWPGLAVGLDEVKANFQRFGLLDDHVEFVQGWFRDTLPSLSRHPWAVIRLDGDFYESTMDALENLYPTLSPGGWLIVDDYEISACRQAVTDFRAKHDVTEPIVEVDWTGICWQKQA